MLQSPILIEALLSLLYSKIKLDALAVFVEVQVSWLKPIGSQNAFYRNHRQTIWNAHSPLLCWSTALNAHCFWTAGTQKNLSWEHKALFYQTAQTVIVSSHSEAKLENRSAAPFVVNSMVEKMFQSLAQNSISIKKRIRSLLICYIQVF